MMLTRVPPENLWCSGEIRNLILISVRSNISEMPLLASNISH